MTKHAVWNILAPKRPTAAKRYWPGLVASVRPLLPSRRYFPSSPGAQCAPLPSLLLTAAVMSTITHHHGQYAYVFMLVDAKENDCFTLPFLAYVLLYPS